MQIAKCKLQNDQNTLFSDAERFLNLKFAFCNLHFAFCNFPLSEVLPVARFIIRVVEQVVQFGTRQHLWYPVALMAVLQKFRERILGRTHGDAKGRERIKNEPVTHRGQRGEIQVGTAAELGHVRQQRGLDRLCEGSEFVRVFERFRENRVGARLQLELGPAHRILKARHTTCVGTGDNNEIGIAARSDGGAQFGGHDFRVHELFARQMTAAFR